MVSATITLTRSLSIKVVAEGVEIVGQLPCLEKLDCELAQGYRFSKPLPADEVKNFLVGPTA